MIHEPPLVNDDHHSIINHLPTDVLAQIFLYLNGRDLMTSVPLVCDQWYSITRLQSHYTSDLLWINQCMQHWHVWSRIRRLLSSLATTTSDEENNKDKKQNEHENNKDGENDSSGMQTMQERIQSKPFDLYEIEKQDVFDNGQQSMEQLTKFHDLLQSQYPLHTNVILMNSVIKPGEKLSFWFRVYRERQWKDNRSVSMLKSRVMWNSRLETHVMNECMDMDVLECLYRSINHPSNRHNLTYLYFASKVVRRLHSERMVEQWKSFIERCDEPDSGILMIHGAIMISRMKSPPHSVSHDNNANDDNYSLPPFFSQQQKHVVLRVLDIMVDNIKERAIETFVDTSYEHEHLFDLVNEEIYTNYKMRGDVRDLENMANQFIDGALSERVSFPIILCAIYQYVCYHAFGIYLLPIGAPGRFLLKWNRGSRFIDAFDNGKLMPQSLCVDLLEQYVHSEVFNEQYLVQTFLTHATPNTQIFARMLANVIESSPSNHLVNIGDYEFLTFIQSSLMLNPNQFMHRLLRVERSLNHPELLDTAQEDHLYIRNHASDVSVFYSPDMVQRLLSKLPMLIEKSQTSLKSEPERPNVTLKTEAIEFSVGQLMKHKKYGYRGVIFGYDHKCTMPEEWIQRMGVSDRQKELPFYHVLVHESDRPTQVTYVCAENITIVNSKKEYGGDNEEASPHPIRNAELGRYFERFDEQHWMYIPNQLTRYTYPSSVTQVTMESC